MLYATPDKNNSLDLVGLVLSLISRNQFVTDTARKDIVTIINQATRLADDPCDVSEDLMPESIDLALQFRSDEHLKSMIQGILDPESITPDVANQMLDAMGSAGIYHRR